MGFEVEDFAFDESLGFVGLLGSASPVGFVESDLGVGLVGDWDVEGRGRPCGEATSCRTGVPSRACAVSGVFR